MGEGKGEKILFIAKHIFTVLIANENTRFTKVYKVELPWDQSLMVIRLQTHRPHFDRSLRNLSSFDNEFSRWLHLSLHYHAGFNDAGFELFKSFLVHRLSHSSTIDRNTLISLCERSAFSLLS